ncbi:MAG: type II toxin-antitoxin system VapC family toxin [Planctomycetia bacterium]|nr:type II toxin-antitoxin system VapC family toxin [Planctomycetia bacterium]
MSFLLDTDVCSAYLKGEPKVQARFLQYLGRLHISTITLGELFTWAKRAKALPKRLQGLLDLLNDVDLLTADGNIAEKFGDIRATLLDAGLGAPSLDMVNAATALVHGLTLVTHNVADYANVPGLIVVDWLL